MSTDSKIQTLKKEYISYYEDVPVQKYAAMSIGRNEDTVIRWKNEDSAFSDDVEKAKAEWVRKRVIASKAEFALERLEKSVFSQTAELRIDTRVDVTPSDITNNQDLIDQSLEFLMEKTKLV